MLRRLAITAGVLTLLSFTGLPTLLAAALWATGLPQEGLAILTNGGTAP